MSNYTHTGSSDWLLKNLRRLLLTGNIWGHTLSSAVPITHILILALAISYTLEIKMREQPTIFVNFKVTAQSYLK